MNKTLTKPKQKLDLDAILASDPIPDEPMTLKELHDRNGGFPFRARRVVGGTPNQGSPVGSVHTVYRKLLPGERFRSSDGGWYHHDIHTTGYKTDEFRHMRLGCPAIGLDPDTACWTFAD